MASKFRLKLLLSKFAEPTLATSPSATRIFECRKDILDDLGLRIKIPQHWYSTDVHNDFEEAELVENDDVIKIRVENEGKVRMIITL